jgi:hypothetical protein
MATALVALVLAGGSAQARVQGGGPSDLDCYAVFDGITAASGTRVECIDGDPACDADGACDGGCEFPVRLCLNQCAAPLAIDRIKAKGVTLETPPLPSSEAVCGGYAAVRVATRVRKKRTKPGKKKFTLTAITGRRTKLDKDKVTLVCLPRADACPPLPETKDDQVAELPPLSVDPPTPAAGTTATVRVEMASASAVSFAASGEGCGGFTAHGPGPSPLVVAQPVGAFGGCTLTAQATTPEGVRTLMARFEVTPTALEVPGVHVRDALFVPGALPAESGTPDDPAIATIEAPGSLINGGAVQLRIHPAGAAAAKSVQIQVTGAGGHAGYYEVPVVLENGAIIVEAQLSHDFSPSAPAVLAGPRAALPGTVELLVQLVDALGNVGNRVLQSFGIVEVASGAVQVSLSWDTPTDVDLHVVEPGGEEIYYGSRTSSTGGVLDLDSNAGCSIDGVNNENVTWTGAPPPGEYVVRVDFWSDCGGLPANYTVTTRVCGEVRTYTGSFAGGTSDRGGRGSGVEIARFSTNCTARVRGKATYEDFAQTAAGLAPSSTMLPIRFAKVEVKRAADDVTLAEGSTRQDGSFDLRFANDGPKGYVVVVMARQDDAMLKQLVTDDAGRTYAVRSGPIDESVEPDRMGLAVEARADGPAPAFNVFDVGVLGASLVRSVHGTTPPLLTWVWTRGRKGLCAGNVSCYFKASKTISVLSIPADPDEYDDLVLLHEYGHYYQNLFSRSDSPGGPHSSSNRVDPRLAWGEGSATFFGNLATGSSLYLDTTPAGVGVRLDIESLPAGVPLGTSDATQTGSLSEALVAAMLWDLADATGEAKDTLARRDAVFAALAYLGGAAFADRGTAGADMVDALDGWFCRGAGDRGDATSGVEGNVVGIHAFNYDFASVPSCR